MESLISLVSLPLAWALGRGGRSAAIAHAVAWMGLVAAFGAIQNGLWMSSAALVTVCVLAPFAAMPAWSSKVFREQSVWAIPALVLPLGMLASSAPIVDGYFVTLVAAFAASLSAGLALFAAASVAANSRALGLLAAAGSVGAVLIGFVRSPIGAGWKVPLAANGAPLWWELPSAERLPEGVRLLATISAPDWLTYVLFAVAGLGAVAFALPGRQEKTARLVAAVGALTAAGTWLAMRGFSASAAPDAQPYKDFTRSLLQTRQADPIVADLAGFGADQGIGVDLAAMAPELALVALGVTALGVTFALRGRNAQDLRLARDLCVRAVGLLWLGWFLAVLLHSSAVGALGIFGAGEWIHVGLTLLATCLLFVGWRTAERPGRMVWTVFAALYVPAWVVLLAVSWGFHALLGLSFSIG